MKAGRVVVFRKYENLGRSIQLRYSLELDHLGSSNEFVLLSAGLIEKRLPLLNGSFQSEACQVSDGLYPFAQMQHSPIDMGSEVSDLVVLW